MWSYLLSATPRWFHSACMSMRDRAKSTEKKYFENKIKKNPQKIEKSKNFDFFQIWKFGWKFENLDDHFRFSKKYFLKFFDHGLWSYWSGFLFHREWPETIGVDLSSTGSARKLLLQPLLLSTETWRDVGGISRRKFLWFGFQRSKIQASSVDRLFEERKPTMNERLLWEMRSPPSQQPREAAA